MTTVTHAGRPVVEARQTRLGLYVTAKEAHDLWQADPEGVKVLDVRTPEEWVFTGHAPMAINIPFAFLAYAWDDEKKGFPWEVNPDFVDLVKARFAPEETILLSCRSGGRAAIAINMLAAAGFTSVYNILDGMEGSRVDDPDCVFHGMRLKNGWKASGLPWTYDLDPTRMELPERETGTLHAGNAEDRRRRGLGQEERAVSALRCLEPAASSLSTHDRSWPRPDLLAGLTHWGPAAPSKRWSSSARL